MHFFIIQVELYQKFNNFDIVMLQYISDIDHYNQVLKASFNAKNLLWIGTADIKDMHVKYKSVYVPYLKVLSDALKRNVSVRIIHAKEPGPNFRKDFDKYPAVIKNLERMLCPRVHFKLIIIDMEQVYIGSANITGAGMGAKSQDRRNVEAGIFTDEPAIVESAMKQFDEVWMGKYCKTCSRKDYCTDGIV